MKTQLLIVATIFAASTLAHAGMVKRIPKTPMEQRIMNGDTIVVGKVIKQESGYVHDGASYHVAVIKVSESVMVPGEEPKTVKVLFTPPSNKIKRNDKKPEGDNVEGGIRLRVGGFNPAANFKVGKEGVWILKSVPDSDVHVAYERPPLYPLKQLDRVKAAVKLVKDIKWTEPVNGLAMTSFADSHYMYWRAAQGYAHVIILHTYLKNTTDEPITICTRVPVEGKVKKVPGRTWPILEEVKPSMTKISEFPTRFEFLTIQPGEVAPAGFKPIALKGPDSAGKYRFNVTYESTIKGTGVDEKGEFKFDNMWSGKLTFPEFEAVVEDEE